MPLLPRLLLLLLGRLLLLLLLHHGIVVRRRRRPRLEDVGSVGRRLPPDQALPVAPASSSAGVGRRRVRRGQGCQGNGGFVVEGVSRAGAALPKATTVLETLLVQPGNNERCYKTVIFKGL